MSGAATVTASRLTLRDGIESLLLESERARVSEPRAAMESSDDELVLSGLHSFNESWFQFLREEELRHPQHKSTSATAPDDACTIFACDEFNMYGRTPMLDKFSGLSVFGGVCPTADRLTAVDMDTVRAGKWHAETSARTTGVARRSSPAHTAITPTTTTVLQEDQSLPQLIAEVLLPVCDSGLRTRAALTACTPGDSPTPAAGSPTKPTDEPALPEEQPLPAAPCVVSPTCEPVLPIDIHPEEFSVEALRRQQPTLFQPQMYTTDPFAVKSELIKSEGDDTMEPQRKLIKFKFSPFEVVEPPEEGGTALKPPLSNLFIMEMEEPPEAAVQPLPCGIYEIESTRIETNSDSSTSSRIKVKTEPTESSNFLFDFKYDTAPPTNLLFDFEYDNAPPTNFVAEKLSLVSLFGGLYHVETPRHVEPPPVARTGGSARYRPLVVRTRPNVRTGNANTPNLMQDYQMKSTLKNYLEKMSKAPRARNRLHT